MLVVAASLAYARLIAQLQRKRVACQVRLAVSHRLQALRCVASNAAPWLWFDVAEAGVARIATLSGDGGEGKLPDPRLGGIRIGHTRLKLTV